MNKFRTSVWHFLYWLLRGFISRRFNLQAELCKVKGPCLIISNHVTTWDPLLLAMSFKDEPISYVASEHIFRWGLISKIICALVDPIPRKKASSGADTVMMSLRKLKAGGNVCIFGEGDCSWDGLTQPIFPATGKLARISGATLICYRIEGGYLSLPRWSKKLRRGKMQGTVVGVYPPEQLRAMKPEEITAIINRDIYEDAWQRQSVEHVRFKGKKRAEGIEQALFLCPRCGKISSVKGEGDRVKCACGLDLLYTEEGLFDPPEPFRNMAQWDAWQHEQLRGLDFPHEAGLLFSDGGFTLSQLEQGHKQKSLWQGKLVQTENALVCGQREFPLNEISSMAMVQANVLLFTIGESYYELRSANACCARKYLAVWKNRNREIMGD